MKSTILLNNIKFPEGLKWHDNALYFCDVHDNKIYLYRENEHEPRVIHSLEDSPVGLTWSKEGELFVTSLYNRDLLHSSGGALLHHYLSLSIVSPGYAHDMTTAPGGIIYISTSGFYPKYNVNVKKSNILGIKGQKLFIAAENLSYPNGIAVTNDGMKCVVSETFAARVKIFDIFNNVLINPKILYAFDDIGFNIRFNRSGYPVDMSRFYPDGLSLSNDNKSVFVAIPSQKCVCQISLDGKLLSKIDTVYLPFDCAVGKYAETESLFIGTFNHQSTVERGYIEHFPL